MSFVVHLLVLLVLVGGAGAAAGYLLSLARDVIECVTGRLVRSPLTARELCSVPLIWLGGRDCRRRLAFICAMRASADRGRIEAAYRASAVPTVRVDRQVVTPSLIAAGAVSARQLADGVVSGPAPREFPVAPAAEVEAAAKRIATPAELAKTIEHFHAMVRSSYGVPPVVMGDPSQAAKTEMHMRGFPHTASCLYLGGKGRR